MEAEHQLIGVMTEHATLVILSSRTRLGLPATGLSLHLSFSHHPFRFPAYPTSRLSFPLLLTLLFNSQLFSFS